MSINERVERGVIWLDKVCPDWRDKVDLDKLDINHADHCILGQLFGDFYEVEFFQDRYGHIDWDKAYQYGFNVMGYQHEELENSWKSLITGTR